VPVGLLAGVACGEGGAVSKPASPITAQWCVELNCRCPKCEEYVNLLDTPDFWDGRKLDIPEHGTDNSDNVEVQCPKCYHEFEVCCEW